MDEVQKIKLRYQKRKSNDLTQNDSKSAIFSHYITTEREIQYLKIIKSHFQHLNNLELLEIGAGEGDNIAFLKKSGIQTSNIYANELLEDRITTLENRFPEITVLPGNALNIDSDKKFDIVFQSTVFTSILDYSFKKKLANKMLELTKENGIVLWYDFIYDNPNNKDVKGVKKKEIKNLFQNAKRITLKKVTVAPPIGRRIGRLYNLFNFLFPFLRSHVIAVIEV